MITKFQKENPVFWFCNFFLLSIVYLEVINIKFAIFSFSLKHWSCSAWEGCLDGKMLASQTLGPEFRSLTLTLKQANTHTNTPRLVCTCDPSSGETANPPSRISELQIH